MLYLGLRIVGNHVLTLFWVMSPELSPPTRGIAMAMMRGRLISSRTLTIVFAFLFGRIEDEKHLAEESNICDALKLWTAKPLSAASNPSWMLLTTHAAPTSPIPPSKPLQPKTSDLWPVVP